MKLFYFSIMLVFFICNGQAISGCIANKKCITSNRQAVNLSPYDLVMSLKQGRLGYCRLGGRSNDWKQKTCRGCACFGYIKQSQFGAISKAGYGAGMHTNGKILAQNSNGCVFNRGKEYVVKEIERRLRKCVKAQTKCDCFKKMVIR